MLDHILESKIAKEPDGCWLWLAMHTGRRASRSGSYGYLTYRGKTWKAARLVYTQTRGPIPVGMTLDHLCRNTICVNPDHLEPVTMRENILRGRSFAAVNARKTHCRNGHALVPGNLYPSDGRERKCATCNRAAVARYKARQIGGGR